VKGLSYSRTVFLFAAYWPKASASVAMLTISHTHDIVPVSEPPVTGTLSGVGSGDGPGVALGPGCGVAVGDGGCVVAVGAGG
jgi:hypothetical protein